MRINYMYNINKVCVDTIYHNQIKFNQHKDGQHKTINIIYHVRFKNQKVNIIFSKY